MISNYATLGESRSFEWNIAPLNMYLYDALTWALLERADHRAFPVPLNPEHLQTARGAD